jgi:competence protein ComFC
VIKKFFKGLAASLAPILDFVLPPICLNCDNLLNDEELYLCKKCSDSIEKINNDSKLVFNRLNSNGLVSNAYSLFMFKEGTPVQTLIHSFKYGQMRKIGKYYGNMLGEDVLKNEKLNADYIVPVPLHISKKRERGYNQSDFICDGLSEALEIHSLQKCLKRRRYTKTQTELSREERKKNVKGAFELRKKFSPIIQGKRILLVDDVITTGSTILECSRVLKESGCGDIIVCSIALAE